MIAAARLVIGLAVALCANAYLVVFLRRWTRALSRPRVFYAVIGALAAAQLLMMLERSLAHAGAPTWLMRAYAPLLLWSATLVQVVPALLVIDLVLRLLDRRGRAARRRGPEGEPQFAGEEAERAVLQHLSSRAHGEVSTPRPTAPALEDAPDAVRRRFLGQIGASTAFTVVGVPLLWGNRRTRFDVELVELPVRIARLPRVLDGFSIVQVSDIHVGAFLGERELARAEEQVTALRPDLLVMTGDLVHLRLADVAPATAWLGRIRARARHGLIAIPGNHEYYVGRDAVLDAARAVGADVLLNQGRLVAPRDGGGFAIVGADDVQGLLSRQGPGPRVDEALFALPPDAPRVLLCHQPQFFDTAASYGFDLQLSGHTHGGQIAPLGPLVARAAYRYVAGLYTSGRARLYVNRGLGTSGPPSRVGVRPEITKIVLVAG